MSLVATDRSLIRAFYIQYTAVLLIILSFMIGSLGSKPATLHYKPAEFKEDVTSIGTMSINLEEADVLWRRDTPTLQAIAEVLLNHDLNVEIKVPASSVEVGTDTPHAMELALKRSERINRYFVSRGIPPSAVRILAYSPKDSGRTAQVTFMEVGDR